MRCNFKISVIIFVLNEEEFISLVFNDIFRGLVEEIIVVDNGSCDNIVIVAENFGVKVVLELLKGYGLVCFCGMLNYNFLMVLILFLF